MPASKKPFINSPTFFVGVQGGDIISFGSGQPDLPPPERIYKILPGYHAFKYGLIQGQQDLREALATQYPQSKADDFVITNGASEALDLTLRALARLPGKKKVLIPQPYYYSYPVLVELAGLTPVFTKLNNEGRIDIKDFKKKIVNCGAALINSPSNPTGKIESVETLREIEAVAKKLGVYLLSDEVYKDLIYERENYLIKGPKVVTINSFSKTYAMCGFRVGYLYARDARLVREVIDIKGKTSMNTSIISQAMAMEATTTPRQDIEKQVVIWKERRDLVYSGLQKLGLDLWRPEGAFYVFPKMKKSLQAVNELFYQHNVITYAGDWFGAPGRIRLSYALDVEKIKEGLARIERYLRQHPEVI